MRIEKIHLNKIKITFTTEDLIEHNITPDAVRENPPRIQKILMNIVRRAGEEVGFTADESRIMVEAVGTEDGSMVMYITKLETEEELKEAMRNAKKKLRLKARRIPSEINRVCITFDDFEDAIRLATEASGDFEGALYFYNDRYHLITTGEAPVYFSEYGRAFINAEICDMIEEHGKKISDRGLYDLIKHFKG